MLYPQVVEVARSGAARRGRRRSDARRVALVTGGSRPLARAVARRLAGDGLAVAINDVGDSAAEVVGAIRDDGGRADAFSADVTDEEQVAELAAAVAGRLGPVEVLVLGAPEPQPEAPLRRGRVGGPRRPARAVRQAARCCSGAPCSPA